MFNDIACLKKSTTSIDLVLKKIILCDTLCQIALSSKKISLTCDHISLQTNARHCLVPYRRPLDIIMVVASSLLELRWSCRSHPDPRPSFGATPPPPYHQPQAALVAGYCHQPFDGHPKTDGPSDSSTKPIPSKLLPSFDYRQKASTPPVQSLS